MTDISKKIMPYYDDLQKDEHHRFKSWEHCYSFFQSGKAKDTDLASLNLGFYLASWGMYRGSSFLLQQDYKVHSKVVSIILNKRYSPLNAAKLEIYNKAENIDLLFELIDEIKNEYRKLEVNGHQANATDTLVTKILLGTLGCIPAYDRFFIDGLRFKELPFSCLNKTNFPKMIQWCNNHEKKLHEVQSKTKYPIMKLVDMYFWQIGKEIDDKKRASTPQHQTP